MPREERGGEERRGEERRRAYTYEPIHAIVTYIYRRKLGVEFGRTGKKFATQNFSVTFFRK